MQHISRNDIDRLEEPTLHSLRGARGGIFGHISPNLKDLDETRNVSEGSRRTLTQKIRRKSPQGFRPRMSRCVNCFFVTIGAYNADDHLSCADFDRFFAYTGKHFQISAQGILRVPKTTKLGTFEEVMFVNNFRR